MDNYCRIYNRIDYVRLNQNDCKGGIPMALVKCPECNHEVSDKAQICPNCGYKLLENNKIKVSVKVPLVASIIYTICVCIYASDYLWNTSSIIMFIIGLSLKGIIAMGQKLGNKIQNYIFIILYIIGAFIMTFNYNMSRLDLDFIDGDFFSSHIYSDSLGLFLAVFQIISVISIILVCMVVLIPKISTKYASITLFISGILGMVFHIYNKVYLNNKWGTASHSTFYIWLGITTLCFFITGVTYLLSLKNDK